MTAPLPPSLPSPGSPVPRVIPGFRSEKMRGASAWLAPALFFTLLLIWEAVYRLGWADPLFTSAPSRIVAAAGWLFANGYWRDIGVSLYEFTVGFFVAAVAGVILGLLLGWSLLFRTAFEPFVTAMDAIPRVALMPLMILWFGLGLLSKIAIVFLGALFPIALSTATGVRTIDLVLIESARSFAATDWQIIRTVVIPGALPSIVTGLRLGANRALVGVIVGELVSSTAGVGRMMAVAGATFQTDKVFAGVVTLAIFGYGLSSLFRSLENYFSQWRAQVVLPDER